MAKLLYAPTEDFIKTEVGRLAENANAGSNVVLTLVGNEGFSANDYVVIGHEGNELAELEQINQSVSPGTQIRVGILKYNHKAGEPVYKYSYDKRKFYGCATIDGTYTELTADGSPKLIQPDDPQGTFIECTDDTYQYFKATYYNSTTDDETDVEDSNAQSANESLRYASIYGIRKHAGLAGNAFYSDLRIERKRVQAESEVNATIGARYILPLTQIPGIIENITELLAAGYIDYEEFGKNGEGVKWLGEARAILKNIGTKYILIGTDGVELPVATKVDVLNGFPDGSTADGARDAKVFRMSDKY